jgi:hypothetical protein
MLDFMGRKNSDSPDSLRSKTFGKVIPPAGPNVAVFREVEDGKDGDDVECLRARRCRMGGMPGDAGTSNDVCLIKSEALVLRLRRLGFLFMAGMEGLMKEGEQGFDTMDLDEAAAVGGWMERPFMFLGFLGAGDVMGRSNALASEMLSNETGLEGPLKLAE